MSRVAWIDASVAAAGDMLLGALIDAGADVERVRVGLEKLGLEGWSLQVEEAKRGVFRALRVHFEIEHDPDHHHPHRPWKDVRAILEAADLPPRAQERALKAYSLLAEAEAGLHGMTVDEVELHEVGALDAILDITGVCLALEDLGVETIIASSLPLGTGKVTGAHGRLPLPAPATLWVLEGWPVHPAEAPGEWVTPTGAALIAALATHGPPPAMVLDRTGYGAGTRDPEDFANLVRVTLGNTGNPEAPEMVVELACNLDDLPGEQVPSLLKRLLGAGALDAWVNPVQMKKGRPGLVLGVLVRPEDADRITDVVLAHSSTLGVRRHLATRRVLDRWVETVPTHYGAVRIKVGGRDGVAWRGAPEHADVAALAEAADVPEHEVHAAALSAWRTSREGR